MGRSNLDDAVDGRPKRIEYFSRVMASTVDYPFQRCIRSHIQTRKQRRDPGKEFRVEADMNERQLQITRTLGGLFRSRRRVTFITLPPPPCPPHLFPRTQEKQPREISTHVAATPAIENNINGDGFFSSKNSFRLITGNSGATSSKYVLTRS